VPSRDVAWHHQLAATLYAQAKGAEHGRPVVTLRMFSTYGPGVIRAASCRASSRAHWPARRWRCRAPGIVRDWVYVDDVVDLYLEAAARAPDLAGRVFNAGSGRGTELGTIVATVSPSPAPERPRNGASSQRLRTTRIPGWPIRGSRSRPSRGGRACRSTMDCAGPSTRCERATRARETGPTRDARPRRPRPLRRRAAER
jgi:nucleoside-diphosphate-sugar epimerase